jgi:GSH-dependent disulfide-bond oxidoreductase
MSESGDSVFEPGQQRPMGAPIILYGAQTGNCIRAAIALEEAGLSYEVRKIDLRHGQHRQEPYLSLNPAAQVPTIEVRVDGAAPLIVTQSNAIMMYAAERAAGRMLPKEGDARRTLVLERFFRFVTDVIGTNYAGFLARREGHNELALMYDERAIRTICLAESYLSQSAFIGGDAFTVADIAAYTITTFYKQQLSMDQLPNLRRWLEELDNRPSIVRGYQALL